jgi:hypothetical protein
MHYLPDEILASWRCTLQDNDKNNKAFSLKIMIDWCHVNETSLASLTVALIGTTLFEPIDFIQDQLLT